MGWLAKEDQATITYSHLNSANSEEPTFTPQAQSWRRKHFSGWRFGVIACAIAAVLVFLVNLIILLWAESMNGFALLADDGKHTLYDGSCDKTKNLNIGVHLMINTLSTVLLSASNYCMQCMSAPTRREVDDAHAKKQWLDIGVQSIRNLRKISWKRALMYWLLALSSLPLHLFYNSTVFSSIAANEYYVYSVNEAFMDPNAQNFTSIGQYPGTNCRGGRCSSISTARQLFDQAKGGTLQRLDTMSCLNAYAQNFQTTQGSLLLVVSDDSPGFNKGEPTLMYEDGESFPTGEFNKCPPFEWICNNDGARCSEPCDFRLGTQRSDVSTWKPFTKEIRYCLSETLEEHCCLQYSVHLAIVVIILNAAKAVMMLYLAFGVKESPLMTVGDAISSFLQESDGHTEGMCLVTKADVRKGTRHGNGWTPLARPFIGKRRMRFASASAARWSISMSLCIVAIGVSIGLLIYGIHNMTGPQSTSAIFKLGLGTVDPVTFIRWDLPSSGAGAVVLNVMVANAPQVALSLIYFTYNGLFTSMSLSNEWSQYLLQRKGLRISSVPQGAQRSTYFLQLPYRFAIPLMVTAGTLHWLVSQSIFLVNVEAYLLIDYEERHHEANSDYMTCGYSPVAMISVIITGFLMVLAAIISGFVRLPSGMPVAGSCSVAISAACHPESERNGESAALLKVQWGTVSSNVRDFGHCSFTDGEVSPPEQGRLYA